MSNRHWLGQCLHYVLPHGNYLLVLLPLKLPCPMSASFLSIGGQIKASRYILRALPPSSLYTQPPQILTCIKLKYVQQPMGKTASGSGSTVIRPSQRIIYDTQEAVVSFLCDNVDGLLKEIQDEWARVSQMVVIAREGRRFLTHVVSQ